MAAGAEIYQRVFLTEIQPKLFPSWSFLNKAKNDDAYVNYNTVEVATAGILPGAVVDRVMLPATINKRIDTAANYQLEELTTDPTLLGYSEELLVNYGKRQSILDQHAKIINTTAANRALYKWALGAGLFGAGNGHVLKSTGISNGVTAPTRTASGPSQTGARVRFGLNDLLAVRQQFFTDNVYMDNVDTDINALLTPAQYSDLLGIPAISNALSFGKAILPSGVVNNILGINIYVRSNVLTYDNSDLLKFLTYDRFTGLPNNAAATDQDAAIFWHSDYVRRAIGNIQSFVTLKSPLYYGDIFDMLVRFGAAPVRSDNVGIVTLMEDNG